jgi:sugar O-acyltransferase (sialic acid O-acetyltransferase NeuD family)
MAESATSVVILGTGGNCFDILDLILALNDARPGRFAVKGFLDDDPSKAGKSFCGYPVLGKLTDAAALQDCQFVNGIGSPLNFRRKESILERTSIPKARFATLIHPMASVSRFAAIGVGTVLFPNVVVAANAVIGDQVIVLANSVINHDVSVGNFGCVASGVCISGSVSVGECCYLGTNSSIIGGVQVARGTMVGMGAVLRENTQENSVWIGNPAKLLRIESNA